MRYRLLYTPGAHIDTTVRVSTKGYSQERLLPTLASLGYECELVEAPNLSDEARAQFVNDARTSMVFGSTKGRKLGNAFGTNAEPFQHFGAEVPGLFQYDDSGMCVAVYPHVTLDGTETITDHLATLSPAR